MITSRNDGKRSALYRRFRGLSLTSHWAAAVIVVVTTVAAKGRQQHGTAGVEESMARPLLATPSKEDTSVFDERTRWRHQKKYYSTPCTNQDYSYKRRQIDAEAMRWTLSVIVSFSLRWILSPHYPMYVGSSSSSPEAEVKKKSKCCLSAMKCVVIIIWSCYNAISNCPIQNLLLFRNLHKLLAIQAIIFPNRDSHYDLISSLAQSYIKSERPGGGGGILREITTSNNSLQRKYPLPSVKRYWLKNKMFLSKLYQQPRIRLLPINCRAVRLYSVQSMLSFCSGLSARTVR